MNRKLKFALGSFLIVAAVATLIYTAARETSAYFLTMDEYAADAATHAGKALRLAGRVSDGSVQWDPKSLDLAFELKAIPPKDAKEKHAAPGIEKRLAASSNGASATLPVRYNGILPDMFGEGRDVIVEGTVQDGVFRANTLLTTCPSKYEAEVTDPDAEPAAGERVASG